MKHRILICLVLFSLVPFAYAEQLPYDSAGENWARIYGGEEITGGSSYLGVDITDVTAERLEALKLKEEHGAEITMVDQDAPAGKAGLKEHDVILTLNGTAVESAAQLRRMIRETPAGRVVTLGISRDGQPLTLKVQLSERHKASYLVKPGDINIQIPPIPPMPDFDVPVSIVIAHSSMRSGLMVENITPQLGEFFGVKSGNGVLVRSVEKGSRSEKAGFRAGDVIVKVNSQPVHDTSDFTRTLRSASGGSATVTVVRDKKEQNLNLTLPEKKDSGMWMEDSFDLHGLKDQLALIQPALEKAQQERQLGQEKFQKEMKEHQHEMQRWQEEFKKQMQDSQRERERLRHQILREWTEI